MNDRPPKSLSPVLTLIDLLRDRASGPAAEHGYTFFRGDVKDDQWLRYRDLDHAARCLSLHVQEAARAAGSPVDSSPRPRAIVLAAPGPSYLKALFAALYAGAIAVTAYPPRARRRDERLDVVIHDSGATVALVDQAIFDRRVQVVKSTPSLERLQWINVDAITESAEATNQAELWNSPPVTADDLAVLQYTSGSTSEPKGVCLTHRNLMSNLRMIYEVFEIERFGDKWSVTWLPPYHDMGLIGGLFQVMYAGECSHVMAPAAFVQKPIRWLSAISKYQATVSGGPNFAYDMCVQRITPEERQSLDLDCWTLAFTGAEPIRESTIHRFVEVFGGHGFRGSSIFPCYGLAEATLIVSGGPRGRDLKLQTENIGQTVAGLGSNVSCGNVARGQQVRIVDPKTGEPLPTGTAGEIWVAGANVSPGYWQRPDATRQLFGCHLPREHGEFLRTGDLGFLDSNGELFVSGRLKELIVIRGRNFQPSDIEAAIDGCHPLLVRNASAAFEVSTENGQGLVVVHEVERDQNDELASAVGKIRQRLVESVELQPHCVMLIPKRGLPKTSSGKVKRLETRRLFEEGRLRDSALICAFTAGDVTADDTEPQHASLERSHDEISRWLVERLASQLNAELADMDVARPFSQYGLDSVSAVQIASELETFIGRSIPATLLYEAPTIEAVAAKLCRQPERREFQPRRESVIKTPDLAEIRSRDIAICGMACRLPGGDCLDEFWNLLRSGQTAITDPPQDRADAIRALSIPLRAGWIHDVDLFDAGLFGISPHEARLMDPQHRLLLETSWRAIENAAIDPRSLAGTTTGVFVGIANADYERRIALQQDTRSAYTMTGNAASMAAHRLSYHLDLHGPSMAVDTACSSSLVAVHQAVRAIQAGDCQAAIVAGVNLMLSHEVWETLHDAQMLSPEGVCKTFDASADGYVRGEGCVAILIKPFRDAIGDQDPVRAVIRGTAINQDGQTNGITAPNGQSQRNLYRAALADAELDPSMVTRIEAHGTGTPLGDPIEVDSLNEVYGVREGTVPLCLVGAVKANVGHLEAAAGLASLIKVVLELERGTITAQPNLRAINPHIDLTDSRLAIQSNGKKWDVSHRVAAVSSFGFGGTNAHLLVSESPLGQAEPTEDVRPDSQPQLITLSASHLESLQRLAESHGEFVARCFSVAAYAEATRRQCSSHRHRLALVGHQRQDIAGSLKRFSQGVVGNDILADTAPTDRKPQVAWMFSGQGGQHAGMASSLYRNCRVFRETVEHCDALLLDEFGYRVAEIMLAEPVVGEGRLGGPAAQTSLFVLQVGLLKMLRAWGVPCSAVIGHSMGEYAAAVATGVMDWQDALRLTARRAEAIDGLATKGTMTVVFASLDTVQQTLQSVGGDLTIAAIDGPEHIVVAGSEDAIYELEQRLDASGIATRPLRIACAFHSALMDPVIPTIRETVADARLRLPDHTYISTLTGSQASQELTDPEYWCRHSRQPVQFVAGLKSLAEQTCDLVLEIGPHSTLCALGALNSEIPLTFLPTLRRDADARESMLRAAAALFVRGVPIDLGRIDQSKTSGKMLLPGYSFRRKRFWIAENQSTTTDQPIHQQRLDTKLVIDRISQSHAASSMKETLISESEIQRYSGAMKQVDRLIVDAMRQSLRDLDIGCRRGDRIIPTQLVERNRVSRRHLQLLKRICDTLTEAGQFRSDQCEGTQCWVSATDAPSSWDLASKVSRIENRLSPVRHELGWLRRCGSALSGVLSGEIEPLSVLFPNGDTTALEALYRDSPLAQCSNTLVAEAAGAVVTTLRSSGASGLRVLEVGAGTGATTSAILSRVGNQIDQYTFSDVSPVLLLNSQRQFGNHARIDFRQLDIELDPVSQGFALGDYDLVIAANVLHATRDVRQSLGHLQRLLRPRGGLLLLEGTRAEPFLDLVFGMTEGWWHFTDRDLRPTYPLLPEHQWIRLLPTCGYSDAVAVPFPNEHARVRECQSVLLAARDPQGQSGEDETTSAIAIQSEAMRITDDDGQSMNLHIDAFQSSPVESRAAALEGYLREALAKITGHDGDEVDLDQPVNNLGIDSLMALQLKNRLETDLNLTVPMVAFLDGKSTRQLIAVALATMETAPLERVGESITPTEPLLEPAEGYQVIGPLSEGQRALWMIHQRSPKSPAYNFAFAARSTHRIDHVALKRACRMLQRRHPVLRTCYRMREQQPVRILIDDPQTQITRMDCRGWTEDRIKQWIRSAADHPFDLEVGPIVRFAHLSCDHEDVLAISIHHIAADLWSMDILVQELKALYDESLTRIVGNQTDAADTKSRALPKPTGSFDDYARWERELVDTESGKRLGEHWQSKLADAPQVLELPTTFPRPPSQTFNGDSYDWSLDANLVERIRAIAVDERTTLFTVLLACYQTFLSRICGQDDLLVGTAAANRGRPEWEGIVGYLLNHLVIRGKFDATSSFRDVIARTHREVMDALDHQSYPFAKLVERLWASRQSARSPMVQTMFIWDKPRNLQGAEDSHPGSLKLQPLLIEQRGAPFDLTLVVFELADEMRLSFRYNTDLFDRDTIESFANSLQTLIDSVAQDVDVPITDISLVGPREAEVIERWNATDAEFDPTLSGYALFHQHVVTRPGAIALESTARRLTYAEVASRATWLTDQLRQRSVGPGDIVAVALPRGIDAVTAILGIWQTGAAYLALEINHPVARLGAICRDANPVAMIVANEGIDTDAIGFDGPCIAMDDLQQCQCHQTRENLGRIDPDSPAYVIFTSGSTGSPKGVVIAHRGVANLALAQHQTFGIKPEDRCLQFASLGFDASVFEMVMAFHAGATLVVLEPTVLRSTTTEITDALRTRRINVATLPPSMLAAMPAERLPELHTLISAGEACSQALVKKWSPGRRMFNAYGPTEATVWATTQLCRVDRKDPSLGRPIANVRTHVVDANLMPMPIGVPGELCLSGPGLALEYINKPDLTAEQFVPNPFGDPFDATLYRTGDRVRWNSDGTLEFLGRIDEQIKINGHRIEPLGIAASIKNLEGIGNAHVTTAPNGKGQQLIAYVVPEGPAHPSLDISLARSELQRQLPCYSVPSQMIAVPELPLTASGKVDSARLPKPSPQSRDLPFNEAAASTDTEKGLLEIWQQVLERTDIGVHDNFFDLGGASLQALQAADLSSRRGWTLSAERMFQYQTIAELAREIDADDNTIARQLPLAEPVVQMPRQNQPSARCSPSDRVQTHRMVIESLGMYLPPAVVSTDEVIRGCRSRLEFPLEDMTGISNRRMAGRDEFSIDLARKAAQDCLRHSRFRPAEIDLLIACNISRYDGPNFEVSFEPSTAAKLKHQIGATSAVAFDVCNACAGFFTALSVAESHLHSGRARKAMIISGEYITHLTRTAQLEIESFLDPRLACLTLGDAGVAVTVELADGDVGFESLELYTAGRHHELCVAQATDRPHGGAIMFTDPIKASTVTLEHSIPHAADTIDRYQWKPEEVQHLITHQTSSTTIDGAIDELNRHFGKTVCNHANTVNNLAQRGNTATTTHWVAVMDLIRSQRLSTGDQVVFAFSGSGQTIGTALYKFDDLPDRIRSNAAPRSRSAPPLAPSRSCGVILSAAAVEDSDQDQSEFTPEFSTYRVVESAAVAARTCLQRAQWQADDVDVLIHTGVYRDHFLSEPAVAAIVAGELRMNDGLPEESTNRTLAFDLSDGGRGSLTACSVIAAMICDGRIHRGLITASEVENNQETGRQRGIAELGSALALARCEDPNVGFGDFSFQSYPQYADRLVTATALRDSQAVLDVKQSEDYLIVLLQCVEACVDRFLVGQNASLDQFDRILLAIPSRISIDDAAGSLNVDAARIVIADFADRDPFTSALAALWVQTTCAGARVAGQRWLIVAAGAGIETLCVEYRHP